MVTIKTASPFGIAHQAGLRDGDVLLSINGHEIRDVLDYRFYLTDTRVELKWLHEGIEQKALLHKGEYDDVGLDFETPLMDKKHSCKNGCVFCFIDQLPKGMRKTLYFKDDDDRLSFLHGNYVTLTNLTDADVERLITMHLSPINVSVHTTNPELRVRMMKNKRAGEVLAYLDRFAKAGLSLCTQIVLCKGLNDGEELSRTMRDLEKLYPALRSCAVVPVGLTKYRENLYPLELFDKEEARKVIEQVNAFGDECKKKYGSRLFFCADELYLKAELPFPKEDYYEEYAQIENGVGMITSMEAEFDEELSFKEDFENDVKLPRKVSICTGYAAYGLISRLAQKAARAFPKLSVSVYRIRNDFFGENVTVAGLLTGKDLVTQLAGKDLGEELLFPPAMQKADEEIFLDDMTPEELSQKLGVPCRAAGGNGVDLLHAILGIS